MPWVVDRNSPLYGRWRYPPGVGPPHLQYPPPEDGGAASSEQAEAEAEAVAQSAALAGAQAGVTVARNGSEETFEGPEANYVKESKKSMKVDKRERELNKNLERPPHHEIHADTLLVKEMRHAHDAIKHVLRMQCERIHARYKEDKLDPVLGALHRQYSVTATGTLKVRRVTLKLRAAATASNATAAIARATPPEKYDAISWTLNVMPVESSFRAAVNEGLAAAGYNNGNVPDGDAQIPVNLDKSLKYALNAIWKKPLSDDEQDGMVEDDLLPTDNADDFEIEDVVDDTPETNAKRARSEAGTSDDSTGVTGAGGGIALPPDVALHFARFGGGEA